MVNSHKEPRAVGDQCLSYTSESRAHHSPCQGSSPQHVAMLACVLQELVAEVAHPHHESKMPCTLLGAVNHKQLRDKNVKSCTQ